MSDEQPQKPKFEPPPWEQEAFERFRAEQEGARRQAELDAALLSAREARPPADPDATAGEPTGPTTGALVTDDARAAGADAGALQSPGATGDTVPPGPGTERPVVSEARVDSMLIQLKGEEPTIGQVNIVFINVLIALFELSGLFVIVQAALLFGKVRATGAAGLLGALASLIMLLVGLGFMGAGFLLFRKHHS